MKDQKKSDPQKQADSDPSVEASRKPFVPPELEQHKRLERLTGEIAFGGSGS